MTFSSVLLTAKKDQATSATGPSNEIKKSVSDLARTEAHYVATATSTKLIETVKGGHFDEVVQLLETALDTIDLVDHPGNKTALAFALEKYAETEKVYYREIALLLIAKKANLTHASVTQAHAVLKKKNAQDSLMKILELRVKLLEAKSTAEKNSLEFDIANQFRSLDGHETETQTWTRLAALHGHGDAMYLYALEILKERRFPEYIFLLEQSYYQSPQHRNNIVTKLLAIPTPDVSILLQAHMALCRIHLSQPNEDRALEHFRQARSLFNQESPSLQTQALCEITKLEARLLIKDNPLTAIRKYASAGKRGDIYSTLSAIELAKQTGEITDAVILSHMALGPALASPRQPKLLADILEKLQTIQECNLNDSQQLIFTEILTLVERTPEDFKMAPPPINKEMVIASFETLEKTLQEKKKLADETARRIKEETEAKRVAEAKKLREAEEAKQTAQTKAEREQKTRQMFAQFKQEAEKVVDDNKPAEATIRKSIVTQALEKLEAKENVDLRPYIANELTTYIIDLIKKNQCNTSILASFIKKTEIDSLRKLYKTMLLTIRDSLRDAYTQAKSSDTENYYNYHLYTLYHRAKDIGLTPQEKDETIQAIIDLACEHYFSRPENRKSTSKEWIDYIADPKNNFAPAAQIKAKTLLELIEIQENPKNQNAYVQKNSYHAVYAQYKKFSPADAKADKFEDKKIPHICRRVFLASKLLMMTLLPEADFTLLQLDKDSKTQALDKQEIAKTANDFLSTLSKTSVPEKIESDVDFYECCLFANWNTVLFSIIKDQLLLSKDALDVEMVNLLKTNYDIFILKAVEVYAKNYFTPEQIKIIDRRTQLGMQNAYEFGRWDTSIKQKLEYKLTASTLEQKALASSPATVAFRLGDTSKSGAQTQGTALPALSAPRRPLALDTTSRTAQPAASGLRSTAQTEATGSRLSQPAELIAPYPILHQQPATAPIETQLGLPASGSGMTEDGRSIITDDGFVIPVELLYADPAYRNRTPAFFASGALRYPQLQTQPAYNPAYSSPAASEAKARR